jgi:ribonuclease HI
MSGTAAIGVVARNDQGVVVAALSAPISACYDVEEAEARAILEGLQMASDLKIKCVALESDSALAVDASNATTRNHSQFWSVYKETGLAKSVFSSCSISYTRRKLNSLAHELAKRASVSGVCSRWFDPVPEDIASLAKRDLVNIVYV